MSNNRYYQAAMQLADGVARAASKAANIGGNSSWRTAGLNPSNLHIGVVIQSRAGTYDAQVRIGSKNPIPCVQAASMNGHTAGFGHTHSQLLQEGTLVLVYKPKPFGDFGIIVSTIPAVFMGKGGKEQSAPFMIDPEPGAASFTEESYTDPQKDKKYLGIVNANAGRALDLFPGDQAIINELGVGIALLHLAAQMRASSRAKLEMFCLDDLVRMVSGQYQHFSGIGEEHIYNDYGYVTHEQVGSGHQCEVLGMPQFGQPLATKGSADAKKAKTCEWKAKKDEMIPHRRFHSFMGHLGGLYQFFVTSPDDSKEQSTYGEQKDKALAHFAVDDGGRIYVRSVSDIRLERCDMIALPRKNKEPWDPEGEKLEDGYEPKEKKPFEWAPEDRPAGRPLRERDYFAWARRLTYLRFWELSDLNGKKDWILKEEADAERPVNKYDVILKNEEDYTSWEDRISSISLRKDGGITMRNDAGSEISLCGADIILTCPGDIQLRSGGAVLAMAKTDVVLKARHSVDIIATEQDVRVKAQKKLLQYAGETLVCEVGVVDQDAPAHGGETEKMEKGIIMRAAGENIVMWGRRLQFSFTADMVIEGIKGAATKLYLVVKELLGVTGKTTILAQSDGGSAAGLLVTGSAAALFGSGAHLIAKDSANIIQSGQAAALQWADLQTDPYPPIAAQTDAMKSIYLDSDDWLGSWSEENRKRAGFGYRTEKDYGTTSGYEVYESFWTFVARKGSSPPGAWGGDIEIRKTMPWPGKSNFDGAAMLFELDEEVNIEDTKKGTPKKFDARKETGGKFSPVKFSEYKG